ncbi:hypothetical protein ACNKHW_18150 [Shigella flexneri]
MAIKDHRSARQERFHPFQPPFVPHSAVWRLFLWHSARERNHRKSSRTVISMPKGFAMFVNPGEIFFAGGRVHHQPEKSSAK